MWHFENNPIIGHEFHNFAIIIVDFLNIFIFIHYFDNDPNFFKINYNF